MTKADLLVERGARGLQKLATRAAGRGDGIGEWLAEELNNDADFLRKLKPSLIAARVKANGAPPSTPPPPRPAAPTGLQLGRRPRVPKQLPTPSPLIVVGVALAAGIVVAKVIDWRGHAHPRG